MCWHVCFTPQSGDFLTVDRCKVQGGRYQDDSVTDTTIGVCFWNSHTFFCFVFFIPLLSFFLSFFFFLLLNTLEHPFLTFFFSNPLPSPLECPFAPVGLSCFPGKRKEGRERARACKLNSIVLHYGSAEQARQLHAG